jgi:hypothetical protein
VFADVDPEEELPYDLENGSTLRDLLEALSAGGPTSIMAAMRWIEYRLYRDAADARRDLGGIVAQIREGAVKAAQTEREILRQYIEDEKRAQLVASPDADELSATKQALRDANRALFALGQGPFLPGTGQLAFPTAGPPAPQLDPPTRGVDER